MVRSFGWRACSGEKICWSALLHYTSEVWWWGPGKMFPRCKGFPFMFYCLTTNDIVGDFVTKWWHRGVLCCMEGGGVLEVVAGDFPMTSSLRNVGIPRKNCKFCRSYCLLSPLLIWCYSEHIVQQILDWSMIWSGTMLMWSHIKRDFEMLVMPVVVDAARIEGNIINSWYWFLLPFTLSSYHEAITGHLITRSREISKPYDISLQCLIAMKFRNAAFIC